MVEMKAYQVTKSRRSKELMPKEVRILSPLIRKKGKTQKILGKRRNPGKIKGEKN